MITIEIKSWVLVLLVLGWSGLCAYVGLQVASLFSQRTIVDLTSKWRWAEQRHNELVETIAQRTAGEMPVPEIKSEEE